MGAFLEWSPDGAWLAGQPEFCRRPGGDRRVSGLGGGFRILAPGYDPAWSPFRRPHRLRGCSMNRCSSLRSVNVASGRELEIQFTSRRRVQT